MADGGQRHTRLVRALSGTLVIVAGVVPIVVNYPYLSSRVGDDRMIAWSAAVCGLAGVLMGLWILLARRAGGKPLVVTRRKWRYGTSIVTAVLGAGLLVAALTAPQPQVMTGVPALFIGSSMLQLFVPEGTEQDEAVPLSDAQRRTWRRGIAVLGAIGFLALCGAVALAVSGNLSAAGFLVPFGVMFLLFAVLMKRQFARRQNEAPQRT
ncbi:hypothetical protein [Kocuria rosea]|uniref:hypothetical protein n=1 Tax=Kocuria rosea TaxID=1275 RepID=UPI002540C264|nr:hypothetical protein [Kocuria rosea]WIG18801.1 hypothetical protein QOY29_07760 [Kocuria rosea]